MELLEKPLPDEYHIHNASSFGEAMSSDDSPSNNFSGRLWLLLQHRMINPRAWPCWNPDILKKSTLTSLQRQESHMLDDDLSDPVAQQSFHDDDPEYLLDSQETLIDDRLYLSDDLFDDIGLMDGQDSEALAKDIAFADEDEILDEDSFWAELDVGAADQGVEEIIFEDILDFDEAMAGGIPKTKPRAEEAFRATHDNFLKNDASLSHQQFPQTLGADHVWSEPLNHRSNGTIDDGSSPAVDNSFSQNGFGAESFSHNDEILDESRFELLGETGDEIIDAAETSIGF